jgi:hypothetical protein
MSENERRLTDGLDALAAELDEHAPPRVKVRLLESFRHKHRRRIGWTRIAAALAVAGLLASLRWDSVPPKESLGTFIALDDGPVESGVVVRVHLPGSILGDENAVGEVEADVWMGNDGQAHAVRFVH